MLGESNNNLKDARGRRLTEMHNIYPCIHSYNKFVLVAQEYAASYYQAFDSGDRKYNSTVIKLKVGNISDRN